MCEANHCYILFCFIRYLNLKIYSTFPHKIHKIGKTYASSSYFILFAAMKQRFTTFKYQNGFASDNPIELGYLGKIPHA